MKLYEVRHRLIWIGIRWVISRHPVGQGDYGVRTTRREPITDSASRYQPVAWRPDLELGH